jgi:predicted nucleotidyltransferase
MVWRRTTVTARAIADVVAQIVERFHPQQVILFGSYASGTPTPDSDVDLLVVMETPLQHVEQAVAIRQAVDFPFPVDVLVRTPQHIAARFALGDGFLREVLTTGVVLYAANDTGMGAQSQGHCPSGGEGGRVGARARGISHLKGSQE